MIIRTKMLKSGSRHTPRTPDLKSSHDKFRGCKFVKVGFQKYKQHAYKQKELLASGKFVEILVDGLRRLNSLQSITVKSRWERPRSLDKCSTGSPLARSWDTFHLRPTSWDWAPTQGKSFVKRSRTSFNQKFTRQVGGWSDCNVPKISEWEC